MAKQGKRPSSALRKTVALGRMSPDAAAEAVGDIFSLGVEEVPATPALHRDALALSARIGQPVAYAAADLALAASAGAALWTADRRLAESCRRAGLQGVRYLFDGAG